MSIFYVLLYNRSLFVPSSMNTAQTESAAEKQRCKQEKKKSQRDQGKFSYSAQQIIKLFLFNFPPAPYILLCVKILSEILALIKARGSFVVDVIQPSQLLPFQHSSISH